MSPPADGKIGLALSGRGFRAAFFHVAVLLRDEALDALGEQGLGLEGVGVGPGASEEESSHARLADRRPARGGPEGHAALVLHPARDGFNQGRLEGVGARIVAETFHGAMQGSQISIVRDPGWRPTRGPNNKTFRMEDLLLFAFEGKKSLLAPLG